MSFDLSTSKWGHGSPVSWTSFLPIFTNFQGWYISGTAERNDCVSFRILQEYDNLRNGMAERTVIGRNGTLTQTLCLTLTPNPTLTLKISVIYAVQLPNVFRKLIATIRRVPWIILF